MPRKAARRSTGASLSRTRVDYVRARYTIFDVLRDALKRWCLEDTKRSCRVDDEGRFYLRVVSGDGDTESVVDTGLHGALVIHDSVEGDVAVLFVKAPLDELTKQEYEKLLSELLPQVKQYGSLFLAAQKVLPEHGIEIRRVDLYP